MSGLGETLAEFDHVDGLGQPVLVSAESVDTGRSVWLSLPEGAPNWPTLDLTPAEARDIAASLLLAADYADDRMPS
jgi:hypothetical protein